MYYDTKEMNDTKIDTVLRFLFEYEKPVVKRQKYKSTLNIFQNLDLASTYFLFSLISERLPHRAKVFFIAEDYEGKKKVIFEVMESVTIEVN